MEWKMNPTTYVIPLKNGRWRVVQMGDRRYAHWFLVYRRWWVTKGHRLAISPEMWRES
jgi:hypothetical protein